MATCQLNGVVPSPVTAVPDSPTRNCRTACSEALRRTREPLAGCRWLGGFSVLPRELPAGVCSLLARPALRAPGGLGDLLLVGRGVTPCRAAGLLCGRGRGDV